MIVCKVRRGGQERTGVISGSDVYGFTAAAVAKGAMIAAKSGFEGVCPRAVPGIRAEGLLADLDRFDVRWQVRARAPSQPRSDADRARNQAGAGGHPRRGRLTEGGGCPPAASHSSSGSRSP